MNSTTILPWTEAEQNIKADAHRTKIAIDSFLQEITELENDRELKALLDEMAYKDFIIHVKNLALETIRYKDLLKSKALTYPTDNHYADTLVELQNSTVGMTNVVRNVREVVKNPTEDNQQRLKTNVDQLTSSMQKMSKISGYESNAWYSGVNLCLASISAVLGLVLNPICFVITAINLAGYFASIFNSADRQFDNLKEKKNSFANAATNLFAYKKQQPTPSETLEITPEKISYPKL